MSNHSKNMCDFCEKSFHSVQDLELHINQAHIQPCPETTCTKSFQNGSDLLKHYTKMHRNYDLACDKCGKTFSCPRNTVGHKILCTECLENGEFYKCDFCSQTFTSKILRSKHTAKSHNRKRKCETDFSSNENAELKKSKCGNCGEGFKSLDLLDLTENSPCDLVCKLNKIILAQNELIKGLLDKVKNKERDDSNFENEYAEVIDIKEEWQRHLQE